MQVISVMNAMPEEPNRQEALKRWLQEFISKEGIELKQEDDTGLIPKDTESEELPPHRKIHVVPKRLRKVHEREEDCFTPQGFALGLHNLVSCFDDSKLDFKFKLARAFSRHVFPQEGDDSGRWKQLVKDIVGPSAKEHKSDRDAYQGFRSWTLEVKSGNSNLAIEYWHFALLLAVDAIFLVLSLEATRYGLDFPDIKLLTDGRLFEITEFLKWDLCLVENQVPLRLLRAVVELVPDRLITEGETKDMRFDAIIQHAVWISYPILPNDLERRSCEDFLGCCCPFSLADDGDFHPDPEEGSCRDGGCNAGCLTDDAFNCFRDNWEKKYKMTFEPENCAHILDCTYVVSSWLRPVHITQKWSFIGRQNKSNGEGLSRMPTGRQRSQSSVGGERRGLQCSMLARACSRLRACGSRSRRHRSLWTDDRIPSATHLKRFGVKIRGVATSIASPSFDTISIWTVISSMFCFVSLLACCFESSRSSMCTARWQACLELPKVKIYTETKRLLRNLAVYEELSHDCRIVLWRNYVRTMRCLLETEDDVLLLIRSGVVQSHLAGALEVVQTWKIIDDGLMAAPLGGPWIEIYHNLHEHLRNRWKNWYARFWIANCSNPIVACSFVIFVSLFLLTAIGTYLNLAKAKADKQQMWP